MDHRGKELSTAKDLLIDFQAVNAKSYQANKFAYFDDLKHFCSTSRTWNQT